MNILIIILPCLLLLSCSKETVIEEKFPEVSLARKQREQASTEQLSGYLDEISDKTQKLNDFSIELEQDFKEINQLFQSLESIDLLDFNLVVNASDSEKYQQFYEKSDTLLAKIEAKNYDELYKKVYELSETSLVEEKLLADSLLVRKQVDQINDYSRVAKDQKKKIDDLLAVVENQRISIGKKINQASVNFGAQLGDRGEVLANLQVKADTAKSLADIDNILADPRIFSLETEIATDEVNGPKFLIAKNKFPELFSQLKKQALDAKNLIDQQLAKVPTNSQEVENLARTLDLSLENKADEDKLVNLTVNEGVTPAHIVRRLELDALINPPAKTTPLPPNPSIPPGPPPGGPPPPPGGLGTAVIKPLVLINSFKEALDKISSTQANTVETSIKNELTKLSKFYESTKLENIKNAVSKAKDPQSYKATYQKLSDLVSSYTIDGIRNLLDDGGAEASDDESLFNTNLAKLKKYFSTTLFTVVQKSAKDLVDQRIRVLKNHFDNLTSIKMLDNIIKQLEKDKDIQKIITTCENINNSNYLKSKLPCDKIKNTHTAAASISSSTISDLQALSEARKSVSTSYSYPREYISNATNKTDFFAALKDLNKILSNPIDITAFPNDEDYTVKNLIDKIINTIENKSIAVNSTVSTYKQAIEDFNSLLSSTMTSQEIDNIAKKLAKGSKDSLAKNLAAVLSSEAYLQFTTQFSAPSNQVLIAEMKKAALSQEMGVDDFLSVYQATLDANDDVSSQQALNRFAEFFIPTSKTKIKQIALLPARILTLGEQVSEIKNQVEKNPKYLAIKFISDLDENNIDKIAILSGSVNSLEEKFTLLPSTLNIISDSNNSPVSEFKNLKEVMLRAISALVFSSPLPGTTLLSADKTTIEPIANAFSLVFLSFIDKLDSISFDGIDDAIIAQITSQIKSPNFADYVRKFKNLKSALRSDISNHNIIDKITSIRNKITARPENTELTIFIDNLLQ